MTMTTSNRTIILFSILSLVISVTGIVAHAIQAPLSLEWVLMAANLISFSVVLFEYRLQKAR